MNQKHRIFVAINLPANIKLRLSHFREKWEFLPVRWTKKNSLHLTLVFIGYVSSEEMYEICKIVRGVINKYQPFFIEFEKILYGPPARLASESVAGRPGRPPRMIWLKGKPNDKLSQIKHELERAFVSSENIGNLRLENRPYSPHITLARMKMEQWRTLQETPPIDQDFKVSMSVESIEVMESRLERAGAEYTVLESCPLGM